MYLIIEIRKYKDGMFGQQVSWAETRLFAESMYHDLLSKAALSEYPEHTVVLLEADGTEIAHQCYTHDVAVLKIPEVNENGQVVPTPPADMEEPPVEKVDGEIV